MKKYECFEHSTRKILVIAPLPPPYNGQSVASQTLVDQLRARRIEVTVLNLSSIGRPGRSGKPSLPRCVRVFSVWVSLLRLLRRERPRGAYITVSQSRLGFYRDALLLTTLMRHRIPCVAHVHGASWGNTFRNADPVTKKLIRHYYKELSRVIVLSPSLKDMFAGVQLQAEPLVVPNGVDDSLILSAEQLRLKEELILRGERRIIRLLFLSNLIESKGFMDVLEGAVLLKREGVPFRLSLAGAFESSKAQRDTVSFIEKNGLADDVAIYGVVTGELKRRLLSESDVYLLPTYYPQEGLPLSMLEAMAQGLALVVTRHGAIGDVVREGVNGIIVPPRSPSAIAQAVKVLLDPLIRAAMLRRNAELARSRFSASAFADAILEVFNLAFTPQ